MHLETEEKNIRCLNSKLFDSVANKRQREQPSEAAQEQREPQLRFRCLWEQTLVRIRLAIVNVTADTSESALWGFYLNFHYTSSEQP